MALPHRPLPRLLTAAASACLAVLLGGCMSGGEICSPMEAQEKQEDEKAKVTYYTDAAKTYYEGGKYEASAKMWEKVIAATPGDQWAKFGLAKSLQMQGTTANLRRSEKLLVEILPLDWTLPNQGDVRFRVQMTLGSVYSDLADFYDRDVRVLDARLEEEPSPEASAQLKVQKQGQVAKRNELLQQSIPLFEQVLVRSKEDPYALAGLAKSNLLLGNDGAGIDYAKRYMALSQRSQVNWRKQLDDWAKLMGKQVNDEQRGFFVSKIQGAREKEKSMHLLLGSVYMRREEYADAVAEYDEVLRIDPATPPAYVERAQGYARLNQYTLAVRDLEEYLKLTDPVKQRNARVNAADLLDRYRRLAGSAGLQPASAAVGPPTSGSPDGNSYPAPAGGFPAPRPR